MCRVGHHAFLSGSCRNTHPSLLKLTVNAGASIQISAIDFRIVHGRDIGRNGRRQLTGLRGLAERLNDNLECAVFKDLYMNRRTFIRQGGLASAALLSKASRVGHSLIERQANPVVRFIETPVLTIGYEENGDRAGFPIVLLHGFPDDVRAWDEILPSLVKAGYRILVPYLRGYGPTRFRDPAVPRTAEQAAIAQDLIDFVDGLGIERFAVAGYDWGGRAACIAAVLNPGRIRGAVIIGGYTIQNTIAPSAPADPETERALWYQWYFNTERGRAGLTKNRRGICRLLWETWSPNWQFSDEEFNRTAASFDNADFVDVVIHSYRHRYGNAPGEKRFLAAEQQLAEHPKIRVPTITIYGANDGVGLKPPDLVADRARFTSLIAQEVVAGVGHFLPREKPGVVSSSVLRLLESAVMS